MNIWITGASEGIGAALARLYVERGHTVALSARSAEKLQALASDLGPQATAVPVDVTDRTAMQAAAAQIEETTGPIDMVILGAAFWRQVQPLEFDAELIKGHFDVNVMGTVHGIEAVLPSMRRRRSGTIVGLASVAGYRGLPKSEGYSATKAALINMLESLRIDLRPCGIRVITVCPGFVRTRLTSKNTFPMPFMLEPDDAARRIARGIDKGKAEVVFPLPMAVGMKALRLIPPGPYAWAVSTFIRRN